MKKTPLRQRLGDRVAKTIVVGHQSPVIQKHLAWWRFVLALAVFFILNMATLTTGLLANGQILPLQSLIRKTAADINLQQEDLISFKLSQEEKQEPSTGNANVDLNQRLFSSTGVMIVSRVAVFHADLTDKTSDVVATIEKGLRQEFKDQVLIFDRASDINIGERGSLERFSNQSAGAEGYSLFFIKQNVFVRILAYGQPGKIGAKDVQALARTIEERTK